LNFSSNISVLDPRLKLEYYKIHEWEAKWIQAAKTTVYTTYNETYAPLPGSVYQETSNILDTKIRDDVDAALQQHIFNKRQRLMLDLEHEVDIYLRSEALKYSKDIDTLSWWNVSSDFIFNSNYISSKPYLIQIVFHSNYI